MPEGRPPEKQRSRPEADPIDVCPRCMAGQYLVERFPTAGWAILANWLSSAVPSRPAPVTMASAMRAANQAVFDGGSRRILSLREKLCEELVHLEKLLIQCLPAFRERPIVGMLFCVPDPDVREN